MHITLKRTANWQGPWLVLQQSVQEHHHVLNVCHMLHVCHPQGQAQT